MLHNKLTIYKYYFVTYFFTLFDNMFVVKEEVDTLIEFCIFSRVRVYTKNLAKVATFLIWVTVLNLNLRFMFLGTF